MSQPINSSRRKLLQLSLFASVTLLVNPTTIADELLDLVNNNQIIAIRLWPSQAYTRLTIETIAPLKVKYYKENQQLVIDIKNIVLNDILKNISQKIFKEDPIIANIEVTQFNKNTVRIVIYLKIAIRLQTKNILPVHIINVDYKHRFVIDMYPENDDLLSLLEDSTKRQIKKLLIMLDPGHGGEDPGAIGSTGLCEKHVVLAIAQKLGNLINNSATMQALYTRTQDIFIPLATRVALARRSHADLFISLHADAFTTSKPRGSSVFILSNKSASSSFAKWLAKTQNAADKIGGVSSSDYLVNRVLLDMSQSWTLRKSSQFGNIILNKLKQVNQLHSPNVENAAFAVLKSPDIPSILIETAFISNPIEEQLLNSNEFCNKIALAIFDGIAEFSEIALGE